MKMKNENTPVVSSFRDRQEIVSDVAGFYAPTSRELSETLAIISSKDNLGIEQHFQEIYRRQQINGVAKPERAIASITEEYLMNYRSAFAITKQLGNMALSISEIYNPRISLAEEVITIQPAHRSFVRFTDLKEVYASGSEDESCIKDTLSRTYYAKDADTISYIKKRLEEINVKEARHLVVLSILDQQNRQNFWKESLNKLRLHKIAGPIIRRSLVLG